jgi:hypothetical protein
MADQLIPDLLVEIAFHLAERKFPLGMHRALINPDAPDPYANATRRNKVISERIARTLPFFRVLRAAVRDLRSMAQTCRAWRAALAGVWKDVYEELYALRHRIDQIPARLPPAPAADAVPWTRRQYEVGALLCMWPAEERLKQVLGFDVLYHQTNPATRLPAVMVSSNKKNKSVYRGVYFPVPVRGQLQQPAWWARVRAALGPVAAAPPAVLVNDRNQTVLVYRLGPGDAVNVNERTTEAAIDAHFRRWRMLGALEESLKDEVGAGSHKRKHVTPADEELAAAKLARFK